MKTAVPVLVVGAGPTGLLLAAELHRHGVDCLLVDAHERPMEWDRATVVHPRSLEIFESLGIVEPLLRAGVKQRRARIHAGGVVLGEIDLEACGSRYPYNIGISEEVTETMLADYLVQQGGDVMRATKLVALEETEQGLLATIEHGGAATTVIAQWVVGCDGHHSTVRTLTNIGQDGHDIAEPWAVFDAGIRDWPHVFEANYAFLDAIPVILTAMPDKRWRVYLRPSGPESDLVTDALSTLRLYLPTADFEGVVNPARFQCHTKVARCFRSGRVLLAGDAAHTCSPAQGHGMNSGLQDAFNLAWKLALVCKQHFSEVLLDSYHAERRPVADRVMASGDSAESAQMVKGEEERRERDEVIRSAFADADTRHSEAVAEAELDIDYADSPIVMGHRSTASWPGQRLPDGIASSAATVGDLQDHTGRQGHTAYLIAGALASQQDFAQIRHHLAQHLEGPIIAAMVAQADFPAISSSAGDLASSAPGNSADGAITLLLIRPDGHIGLRAERDHAQMLAAYTELLQAGS